MKIGPRIQTEAFQSGGLPNTMNYWDGSSIDGNGIGIGRSQMP
jgi:hypothetical protein